MRIRVFTVPSGSLCRSASSEWVNPRKYASSIRSRCSRGTVSRACRIALCCSPNGASVSGFSFDSTSMRADSIARLRALFARRRSIARFRAMPTSHAAGGPSRRVIRGDPVPHQHEHLLQNFFGFAAVAHDAQNQAVQQPAVPIVELAHGPGIAPRDPLEERKVRLIAAVRISAAPAFKAASL